MNHNYVRQFGKVTSIISAFPGTGKTHFYESYRENPDFTVMDSDSSHFPKDEWPNNYIEHIKDHLFQADMILVSSHEEVRNELEKRGLLHFVVYPDRDLKKEYMERYFMRDSSEAFMDMMNEKWDEFIISMENQANCNHVILKSGEYLSDRIC